MLRGAMLELTSPAASAQRSGALPFTHPPMFTKPVEQKGSRSLPSARRNRNLAAAQPLWQGLPAGAGTGVEHSHAPAELPVPLGGSCRGSPQRTLLAQSRHGRIKQPKGWCRIRLRV